MIKTESRLERGGVLYMNMVTRVLYEDPRILAFSAKDVYVDGKFCTQFEIYWKGPLDENPNLRYIGKGPLDENPIGDIKKDIWDQTVGMKSYNEL